MKATLNGKVIAESDDIVENGGYVYFPPSAVRMDWLVKVPKTAKDLECPHVRPVLRRGDRRCAPCAQRLGLRGAAPVQDRDRRTASASGRTSRSA